jgi:cytoskeleton protein RodZ
MESDESRIAAAIWSNYYSSGSCIVFIMNTVTEQQADSVGAILRQSREAKSLTTHQVAKQLNLKVAVIEQIEAEHWDPAVSMTFMRGYLRAYARLMKLSEREILQTFELQAAYLRNQTKPMHSFSKKTSLDAAENRFMLATYLLVVLLIGLFLVWFWQTHLLDDAPVSVVPQYTVPTSQTQLDTTLQQAQGNLPLGSTAATGANQQTNIDAVTSAASEPLLNGQVANQVDAPASTNNQAATGSEQAVQPQVEPSQVEPLQVEPSQVEPLQVEPSQSQAAAVSDTAEQQAAVPVVASNTTTPAVTNTTAVANPNSTTSALNATPASETPAAATLQLRFSADCWLEVYDKNNQRLAFGNQAAGKQLELQGELPFNVKLGNPPAASMRLNGVVVDLSAYPAGRVARITLTGQL